VQRILDPAQIEAFAQRSIPRVRLPDPANLFLRRAARLGALSENHAVGDYLRLMAIVSEAQQAALGSLTAELPRAGEAAASIDPQITLARRHRMPLLQAAGWPRDSRWRAVLAELCGAVLARRDIPDAVRSVCTRLRDGPAAHLEEQADLLLAARTGGVHAEAAPFIMAALQVYWVFMVTSLPMDLVGDLVGDLAADRDQAADANVSGVCPACGTLPVASVVRADKQYQGYRFLHCALCATEWHLVRIKCSHCLTTEGIRYHFVEGGSEAIRAESCARCRTYRKIFYQEKDTAVEPVADDLGSLALDLLMTEDGYRRACGNPLLWQPSGA
jgi:FdhE protein